MTVELSKRPSEYHDSTMYRSLVLQMMNSSQKPVWGNEIQYVKEPYGYTPLGVKAEYQLDWSYYKQRIADVVTRLLNVTHGYSDKTILKILEGQRKL